MTTAPTKSYTNVMSKADIYIHLSCDGGIFACWARSGMEAWVTRAQLLDELAALKSGNGTLLLSTESCSGRPSQAIDAIRACIAQSDIDLAVTSRIHPDAVKKGGITTLMQTSYVGREDVVEDLLMRGADIEAKDNAGYTALMYACNGGRSITVETLIRAGADPNAADSQGSTAIMFAAQHGHLEIVRCLLGAGADPNIRGKHGFTSLEFSKQNGHVTVAALISAR